MANQTAAGPKWCFTTSGPTPTPTPTPTPSESMQLLLDFAGPAIDQLASLDSARLLRDPFSVISGSGTLGQGSDQNTKLIVFVKNLQLMEGEPAYWVVVNLRDATYKTYDVLAESVRPMANTDFVQVNLPTAE